MPSTGGLPAPCITAVYIDGTATNSDTIDDTNVYIDISIDAPNCRLYFTTDGLRPAPFKTWIGSHDFTFKYTAPFRLRSGKRVVRAVAVSRDKLLESIVVSKTFYVRDLYGTSDDSYYFSDVDNTDMEVNTDFTRYRSRPARRRSPARTRPKSSDREWIACSRRYPYLSDDSTMGQGASVQKIPDGPFNPINHSGTQINVWGAPPGSAWPVYPPVNYGHLPPTAQRPVQRGLLTAHMRESLRRKKEPEENRPLTVADVRRILAESV